MGRSVMILVPEIALTPQMMARFSAYFGDEVALLHSGLRLTERYDQWKRIHRGEAHIVLGTRSAVFAPLAKALNGTICPASLRTYHLFRSSGPMRASDSPCR